MKTSLVLRQQHDQSPKEIRQRIPLSVAVNRRTQPGRDLARETRWRIANTAERKQKHMERRLVLEDWY